MTHASGENLQPTTYVDRLNEIDFADPDLRHRLDQHLSVVVANAEGGHDDNTAWRIHAALTGINVTVRDALTFGLVQAWNLTGVGVKRIERLRECLERYIPEIPIMDDPAPAAAVRMLYDDPLDVPLVMPAGESRFTIRDHLALHGTEGFADDRVHEVVQAFKPSTDDSVDPTIAAIAAVAVTLDPDGLRQ